MFWLTSLLLEKCTNFSKNLFVFLLPFKFQFGRIRLLFTLKRQHNKFEWLSFLIFLFFFPFVVFPPQWFLLFRWLNFRTTEILSLSSCLQLLEKKIFKQLPSYCTLFQIVNASMIFNFILTIHFYFFIKIATTTTISVSIKFSICFVHMNVISKILNGWALFRVCASFVFYNFAVYFYLECCTTYELKI